MPADPAKQAIHAKVIELARELGKDARRLGYDQPIPATGLLDSAALMELIAWIEVAYGLTIEQSQLTLENFGTIDAMSAFLKTNGVTGAT